MSEDAVLLDSMSREDLIIKAKSLGVERPQVMTRAELRDEIVRRSESDEARRRQVRGWLGIARDLVASVVERGLHLPDAAGAIRGSVPAPRPIWAPPVATVTLAEIYASQGHTKRAMSMLDEVLRKEPDHEVARQVHERLSAQQSGTATGREMGPGGVAVGSSTSECVASPAVEVSAAHLASDAPVGEANPRRDSSAPPESDTKADAIARPPTDPPPPLATGEPTPSATPTLDVLWWRRSSVDSVKIYWELSPGSEERQQRALPAARLVARIAGAYVQRSRCCRFEREVVLERSRGVLTVAELPGEARLRVALGWQVAEQFVPVTLGLELGDRSQAQWWAGLVAAPQSAAELEETRQRAEQALQNVP